MSSVAIGNDQSGETWRAKAQIAENLFRANKLEAAEKQSLSLAEELPSEPEVQLLLALVQLKRRNPVKAEEHLRAAIRIRRAYAPYHQYLARSLMMQGRLDEAEASLSRALELAPADASLRFSFGLLKLRRREGGRDMVAAIGLGLRGAGRALLLGSRNLLWSAYINLLPNELSPVQRQAAVLARRGSLLHANDKRAAAENLLTQALQLDPDNVVALCALANIWTDANRYSDAVDLLARGWRDNPHDADLTAAYVETLSRWGRRQQAMDILDGLPSYLRSHRQIRITRAWCLLRNEAAAQTVNILEPMCATYEQAPRAIYGLARAYQAMGQFDAAEHWLRRLLRQDPSHAHAYMTLANIGRLKPGERLYRQLQRQINKPFTPQRKRSVFWFALGSALRRAGDKTQAMAAYDISNGLFDMRYDREEEAKYLSEITRVFSKDFFARLQEKARPVNDSDVPVFVVGMPRSGTSLVEQILASHPDVHGAGEREALRLALFDISQAMDRNTYYPEDFDIAPDSLLQSIADEYLAELQRVAPEARRIIDKMPHNFMYVGMIATLFPNARIINCQRDPRDLCLSIYWQRFEGHHNYGYDLQNLGHYFRLYERLMDHWRSVLPTPMLDVPYEALVQDQKGWTEKLLTHCGLPWDDACLEFYKADRVVRTASHDQVRKPLYTDAAGRWKEWSEFLDPLEKGLAEQD